MFIDFDKSKLRPESHWLQIRCSLRQTFISYISFVVPGQKKKKQPLDTKYALTERRINESSEC